MVTGGSSLGRGRIGQVSAEEALGKQFQPRTVRDHESGHYPTKGWRKTPDKIKATTNMLGASREYDVLDDMKRKGISPSLN